MANAKQRIAAKKFIEDWQNKGYEKGESQKFWIQLLREVLSVKNPEQFISFEDKVKLDHTSFIDGYIPSTKVLIEQKSSSVDLTKQIRQSDGTLLNPFQQAKRYIAELPVSKHPRYVVTCNFQKFCVYDMERPDGEPQEILLKDLEREYWRLSFLIDTENDHLRKEMEVSIKAGQIVGLLYDALLKQYIDKNNPETLKSLNVLCVRIVFCLYAEDAGIFGKHDMFLNYLAKFEASRMRKALIELFEVLNTKIEDRDPYLEDELKAFPYVNGGLFARENIEIPNFTDEIKNLLLTKASADFDWSDISPTIFGAVFESTLNPQTRRKGGMHYTSIENIHKVIDPLFMDELNEEFAKIKAETNPSSKTKKLKSFQNKLSELTFLDPACGSGNFLTETYISLRKLENEVLYQLHKGQGKLGFEGDLNPIKVSIGQFYGIEINDFAVTVAKTALWIAESQMMKKTEEIVHMDLDFLPLKTYANIIEANALRTNWEEVISKDKLNYIMGNPPFVGYKFQSYSQKQDIELLAKNFNNYGTLDYVSGWYINASKYMKNTDIKCAFVSTNSISQGEHVNTLWKPLINEGVIIIFAHRTFIWDSEASSKAKVHCVIVGFSYKDHKKLLWNELGQLKEAKQINAYLLDAPNVFIEKRLQPWTDNIPVATKGNAAMDNGYLLLTKEEKDEILKKEPNIKNLIRRHLSADDFINNKENYCFWLVNISPNLYCNSKVIQAKLKKVQEYRAASNRSATNKMADFPMLFAEIRQPNTDYIMVPVVSSEKRKYIPMGFISSEIINSYASISIPNANLFHFGILQSNVHNAWVRAVSGRLKSDYRYSSTICYNNFPWCNSTDEQKAKIERTAQGILDARALYPECSLADLYNKLTMPPELRKAHQENDKAVMEAYGFRTIDEQTGKSRLLNESEIVAELMKMYQKLTANK